MKKLAVLVLVSAFIVPSAMTSLNAGNAAKTAACEVACEKQKKKCYQKNKGRFARIGCDKAKKKCVKKCKK